MCGIFGLVIARGNPLPAKIVRSLADRLFLLSETRGREAAGVAIRSDNALTIYKQSMAASRMIRLHEYRKLFDQVGKSRSGIALIGHSRLVTNGSELAHTNNQPIERDGLVAVHNGIVVNDAALWRNHAEITRKFDVDTEIIPALIAHFQSRGDSLEDALRQTFEELDGTASAAILFADSDIAALASNTGSLYLGLDRQHGIGAFTSERYILDQFAATCTDLATFLEDDKQQIRPGSACLIALDDLETRNIEFDGPSSVRDTEPWPAPKPVLIVNTNAAADPRNAVLRRCVHCILPETMPFIEFDEKGVCSYCRDHVEKPLLGDEALEAAVAPYRSKDGSPDCIVAVSGGRDSCYGLHYIKRRLGMNPIAYTYDWGMVTDLARRNQARLCGRLGVEHIVVSADIRRKRRNIQTNVLAWLRKPEIGMVPIFMAGDKHYYYHARQVMKKNGVPLLFYLENERYEQTNFKSGFCGIDEKRRRIYDISTGEKLQLALYYVRNGILNPRYLNTSVPDTFSAFMSSYFLEHDFLPLFRYVPWDEDEVIETLRDEYDWELADDTTSTWRIGDGTAPFYNYIYYTLTGFTEHDTFRSNQIRAGAIRRDMAITKVERENQPRWPSMEWYSRTVGFDLVEAVRAIDSAPRLYEFR